MKSLSTLDIYYLTQELQTIVGAKVDKVFMKDHKDLYLVLHVPNVGKRVLRIIAGKAFYLSDSKPEFDNPSGLCMQFRKYVVGRVKEFKQLGAERIIELVVENSYGVISVIAEMFGKGNIILAKENTIIAVSETQEWKGRTVERGSHYIIPTQKNNYRTMNEEEFSLMLKTSTKESVVKALALDLGIGGEYAEEMCKNEDKSTLPKNALAHTLYAALQQLLLQKKLLNDELKKEYIEPEAPKETKEQKKYRVIVQTQQTVIERMSILEQEYSAIGEAIYLYYQEIKDVLSDMLSKRKQWQSLAKDLPPPLIALDPEKKTITLEL